MGHCIPEGYLLISPGTFDMGAPLEEAGRQTFEGPVHTVTITRPFAIKRTEVTQAEWFGIVGETWPYFTGCGGSCPEENVTWWDAIAYLIELSRRQGVEECYELSGCSGSMSNHTFSCTGVSFRGSGCKGYRLPTEAEWEYAARAGTRGRFSSSSPLGAFAVCGTSTTPKPVGRLEPNPAGLFDVHGNVWEWVHDVAKPYAEVPAIDPIFSREQGDGITTMHVARGGSWRGGDDRCRSARRLSLPATAREYDYGLRPALWVE